MYSEQIDSILRERFGGDCLMALATVCDGIPYVRTVNAHYEDGCFYVITHGQSNKMRHIRDCPTVALSGDWFTGHGHAHNMGWFQSVENSPLAARLRTAFAAWIDNGHNNFDDPNTIILRIQLTDGVLLSHGTRYEL